jgi:hypothetical protein
VHVPTTHELAHEVLEGLTHFDSRLWRSLAALWLRPGRLTLEFVRGRRMAFLPPFRLYLIISVVFFLLAVSSDASLQLISFENDGGQTRIETAHALREEDCKDFDWFEHSHPAWHERLQRGCLGATRDAGHNWRHLAVGLLPKAMFVFVPLIALLHMLMYWRPRHPYAEQLVFFLHLHAFFFSVATVMLLLSMLGGAVPALHIVAVVLYPPLQLWLLVYTLLALRRVFARGWPLTLLKGLALLFGYSVLLSITMTLVFLYAALQL